MCVHTVEYYAAQPGGKQHLQQPGRAWEGGGEGNRLPQEGASSTACSHMGPEWEELDLRVGSPRLLGEAGKGRRGPEVSVGQGTGAQRCRQGSVTPSCTWTSRRVSPHRHCHSLRVLERNQRPGPERQPQVAGECVTCFFPAQAEVSVVVTEGALRGGWVAWCLLCTTW